MSSISAIGQDSHAFDFKDKNKKLILGGIIIENEPPLLGNSDADVILHALTNAVSGITGVNILGKISDELCIGGEKNSEIYLQKAISYIENKKILHISITLEGKRPKLSPYIDKIKSNIARIFSISKSQVGLTATTGEGLTSFGRGDGIQVFCIMSIDNI